MKLQGKCALVTGADPGIGQPRPESLAAIPWRRAGQRAEIARLAVFLACDAADDVTGRTLVMDGSLTMHWGDA